MRIVLLGPPGAGKGMQANKLSSKLSIPQISTGHLFRKSVNDGTLLGLQVKKCLDTGNLVSLDLTNKLIRDRMNRNDILKGFILDGYPRSIAQASALNLILTEYNIKLDAVFIFHISKNEILSRLKSRGRKDDTNKVIHYRIKLYMNEVEMLSIYYRNQLKLINAIGEVDEISLQMINLLHK